MPALDQISQIARRVENLDRARTFWRDALGLPELYAYPSLAFFSLGPTRLMLRETGRRDEADILYLATADIVAAHLDFAATGVVFTQPPHLIHRHADGTEEWMAFFPDDEGRPLGLHMQRVATANSG